MSPWLLKFSVESVYGNRRRNKNQKFTLTLYIYYWSFKHQNVQSHELNHFHPNDYNKEHSWYRYRAVRILERWWIETDFYTYTQMSSIPIPGFWKSLDIKRLIDEAMTIINLFFYLGFMFLCLSPLRQKGGLIS